MNMKLPAMKPRDQMLEQFNRELEGIHKDLNSNQPPPQPPRERMEFAVLTEQSVAAMVEAAQVVFNDAQRILESTKQLANEVRLKIDEQEKKLAEMADLSKAFGSQILEAHKTYIEKAHKE